MQYPTYAQNIEVESDDTATNRFLLTIDVVPKSYKYDVVFIGINPSKADKNTSDQTINNFLELCHWKEWSKVCFYNLSSHYSTTVSNVDDKWLQEHSKNIQYLKDMIEQTRKIIIFWGNGVKNLDNDVCADFYNVLSPYKHLIYAYGITDQSFPLHISRKPKNFHLGFLYQIKDISPSLKIQL